MKLYGKEIIKLYILNHYVGLKVVRRFAFGDGYSPIPYTKYPPWRMLSGNNTFYKTRTQLPIGFVDVSKIESRMKKYG